MSVNGPYGGDHVRPRLCYSTFLLSRELKINTIWLALTFLSFAFSEEIFLCKSFIVVNSNSINVVRRGEVVITSAEMI